MEAKKVVINPGITKYIIKRSTLLEVGKLAHWLNLPGDWKGEHQKNILEGYDPSITSKTFYYLGARVPITMCKDDQVIAEAMKSVVRERLEKLDIKYEFHDCVFHDVSGEKKSRYRDFFLYFYTVGNNSAMARVMY